MRVKENNLVEKLSRISRRNKNIVIFGWKREENENNEVTVNKV